MAVQTPPIVRPITKRISRRFGVAGAGSITVPSALNVLSSFSGSNVSLNGLVKATGPGLGARRSSIVPSQQPGRCYNFDGLDDQINTGIASSSFPHGGGSVSLWFNTDDITQSTLNNRIFNSWRGVTFSQLIIGAANNSIEVYAYASGTGTNAATIPAVQNTWYHVAVVTNGVDIKTYVNGVLVATDPRVLIAGHSDPILFGNGTAQRFNGKLWDARIIPSALTADQVRELYVGGVTALADVDHLLWYKCEDQHPTLALDSSGNGRHGTKSGHSVSTFHYEGSDLPRQTGENEQGFSDDWAFVQAAGDYVNLASTISLTGEFDIEWESRYYEFDAAGRGMICAHAATDYILWGTTSVAFRIANNNVGISYDAGINTAVPHVYRAVRDASNVIRFYIDGVLQTNTATQAGTLSISWLLGRGGSYSWEGWVKYFTIAGVGSWRAKTNWVDEIGSNNGTPTAGVTRSNIPAATASTDALGGTLTYIGKSPIDAKLKQSWCGNFNGTTGHITFASIDDGRFDFQRDDSLDIEFYLKTTDPAGDVMSKLKNAVPLNGWAFNLFGGKLSFILSENFTAPRRLQVDTPINVNDGVMRHFRWTYDGSGSASGVKLYLDGVLTTLTVTQDTLSLPLPSYSGLTFAIGARVSSDFFAGQVCGIKITKNGSLLFHAPLAEGEGSPVTFDVVSGAAGTIVASDTTVGGTFWGRQDQYHYNAAEGFKKVTRFLTASSTKVEYATGSTAVNVFGACTISAKFLTPVVSGANMVIWSHGAANYRLWINSSNLLQVGNATSTGFTIQPNTVYEAEVDFDSTGQAIAVRINGATVWANVGGLASATGGELTLGCRYSAGTPGLFFNGWIWDFSISNYLTWDENWIDTSGNGRHGVLSNPEATNYLPIGTPSNPPALHNGAESQIDWTGGVAFPQPPLPVNLAPPCDSPYASTGFTANAGEMTDEFGRKLPYREMRDQPASAGDDYHQISTASFSTSDSFLMTSFYAKEPSGNQSKRYLFITPIGTVGRFTASQLPHLTVDLADGSAYAGGTLSGNHLPWYEVRDVGNGWWKISILLDPHIAGSNPFAARMSDTMNSGSTGINETKYIGEGDVNRLWFTDPICEQARKYPGGYNPAGIINGLDTDWYAFDTPANPHFQRHISDGYGNILKIDRRVHYKQAILGTDLDNIRKYVRDVNGLLADNFNRQNQTTLGLDWYSQSTAQIASGEADWLSGTNLSWAHLRPLKTADQLASITATNDGAGVLTHVAITNGVISGYLLFASGTNGSYQLYTVTSGTLSKVAETLGGPAYVAGQTIELRVIGGQATGYLDGAVVVGPYNIQADADFTANRMAGIYLLNLVNIDDFKARDI